MSGRVGEGHRSLGTTERTYYRWDKDYDGMKISQARCLEELERENSHPKKTVPHLTLDKLIFNQILEGNY
jgi:hypothetical protein